MQGDADGALQALTDARHLHGQLGTLESPEGVSLLRNIGIMKWAISEADLGSGHRGKLRES